MDNLTHSLTGALAAKLLETKNAAKLDAKSQRALFWLFVFCANLPDIDILLGFLGDPIFSTKHHRGITHSILFAPVMALVPALLWYGWAAPRTNPAGQRVGGRLAQFKRLYSHAAAKLQIFFDHMRASSQAVQKRNFEAAHDESKTLLRFYLVALVGILLHIAFDVITSYGTRLLLPLSETRFALDWMFIVDPFFTIPLGVLLGMGKFARKRRRLLVLCAAIFMAGYLATEMVCSRMAHARTQQALASNGIKPVKVSVLPQPLSVFRWKALAQTEAAIYQAFFSVWEEEPLHFQKFENASDTYVARAIATKELQWYLTFARHPWIRSTTHGEYHLVELTDLQFTFDQALLNTLGASERPMPFIMRFVFSREGELLHSDFNESSIARLGDSAQAR